MRHDGRGGGPYVIIRLLPLVGNDRHYQGRSDAGTVRALLESQITEAVQQSSEDAQPDAAET